MGALEVVPALGPGPGPARARAPALASPPAEVVPADTAPDTAPDPGAHPDPDPAAIHADAEPAAHTETRTAPGAQPEART
ncbi:hypothetical protein [Streptomyces sp.]|uniref:hypothetical protein n=1 Tax=Streptomyces sp. TaxID=1931 RepID=UPI002F42F810